MNRTACCAAVAMLWTATLVMAEEIQAPSSTYGDKPPVTMDQPAATTATPAAAPPASAVVGPAVPTPAYYPDWNCTSRRCPLIMWMTYVPSRRPWFDGHICQKVPNIQAPLYDYFPCTGVSNCCPAGYVPAAKCGPLGLKCQSCGVR